MADSPLVLSTAYRQGSDLANGLYTPYNRELPPVNPLVAATGNKAATAGAATLTTGGGTGSTVHITGFEITGAGATAAAVVQVTVTGVKGGTLTYNIPVPAGVNTLIQPLVVEFCPALPASGPDVDIVVNLPSFGAGNTNAAAVAHGYQVAV